MPAILVRATPRPALSTTKLLLLVLVILGSIYAAAVVLYCSVRLARYVLGKIGWLDIVEVCTKAEVRYYAHTHILPPRRL